MISTTFESSPLAIHEGYDLIINVVLVALIRVLNILSYFVFILYNNTVGILQPNLLRLYWILCTQYSVETF